MRNAADAPRDNPADRFYHSGMRSAARQRLLADDIPTLCVADNALAAVVFGYRHLIVVIPVDLQNEHQVAQSIGAARVMMKGTSAARLIALIDGLLQTNDSR